MGKIAAILAMAIALHAHAASAGDAAPPAPSPSSVLPDNPSDIQFDLQAPLPTADAIADHTVAIDCHQNDNAHFSRWYVDAEALILWRTKEPHDSGPDFGPGAGPRIFVGFRTTPVDAWEFGFFSVSGIDAASSGALPYGDWYEEVRTTDLFNLELNYVHTWGQLSILAGFRFLQLNDGYEYLRGSWYDNFRYDLLAANSLIGGQLGLGWAQSRGNLYYEFSAKAGIFDNEARGGQVTAFRRSIEFIGPTESGSNAAFVGDLNLTLGYQLSEVWSLRAGYNALWVDQFAIALQLWQLPQTHSAFFHGPNFGLAAEW